VGKEKHKVHVADYLSDMDRVSLERLRAKDKSHDDLEHKKVLELEELELDNQIGDFDRAIEKREISVEKSTKYTKDDLVKLDVIADKSKIIEAQKLMKEGMKDMKEAMRNKGMLNDIKKDLQKNKELNK